MKKNTTTIVIVLAAVLFVACNLAACIGGLVAGGALSAMRMRRWRGFQPMRPIDRDIEPSVPTALFVAYAHDGNELTWQPCPDKDFRYFRIYRGPDDEFVPGPETLVKITTGTDWLDPVSNPWHHRYKLAAVDFAGNESAAAVPSGVSGTPDTPAIPQRFALHQCVPNPFNPLTRIRYELPQAEQVRLDVFSASGRLVATIVHAEQPPGAHEAVWEGRDTTGRVVAAGVYFYRLEAGSFVDTKRMVLVK